jgi:pimeloyl-ACP methyl ester carboxylesterase
MNLPEWLRPGIYGAIVGAITVSIVGFSWGGWVTGSTANRMAADMAHNDVVDALVPVCLNNSLLDSDRIVKLATIKKASKYNRRDAVMEAGWATVPGSEKPNRDLAEACAEGLELDAS